MTYFENVRNIQTYSLDEKNEFKWNLQQNQSLKKFKLNRTIGTALFTCTKKPLTSHHLTHHQP